MSIFGFQFNGIRNMNMLRQLILFQMRFLRYSVESRVTEQEVKKDARS